MQNLRPHPKPADSESAFSKGWFLSALRFENHSSRITLILWPLTTSGYLDLNEVRIQLLRHNSHISSAHLQLVTTILNSINKNHWIIAESSVGLHYARIFWKEVVISQSFSFEYYRHTNKQTMLVLWKEQNWDILNWAQEGTQVSSSFQKLVLHYFLQNTYISTCFW